MKKIVIVSSYSESLIIFRKDLMQSLIDNGYEVYALGPDKDEKIFSKLREIGVTPLSYFLNRKGLNPFSDIKSIWQIRKILKRINPDFVLPYTAKPVIYSNLAKKGLSIYSINWITGLGFYAMPSRDLIRKMAKKFITLLYRISLDQKDKLVFQNLDDLELFRAKKIITKHPFVITPGSGVNLSQFDFSVPDRESLKFLFVGRLIKSKGIELFLEAAAVVKAEYKHAQFIVVGWIDQESSDRISQETVDRYKENGIVEFTGKINNVDEYIKESSVFVLPSMYREGVPRSILEALSVGRAVITTDNVGCRETVVKDYNGILIEKNNATQLAEAMRFFCKNPNKIIEYGKNSRSLAESKFDVKLVNEIIINAINSYICDKKSS